MIANSRVAEAIILAAFHRNGFIFGRTALFPALASREDVCAIGPLTPPNDIDVAFVIDNNPITECLKVGVDVTEIVVSPTETYVSGITDNKLWAQFAVDKGCYYLKTAIIVPNAYPNLFGSRVGDLKHVEFVPVSRQGLTHLKTQYDIAYSKLVSMDAKEAYSLWQERYSPKYEWWEKERRKGELYRALGVDYGINPDGNNDLTKLTILPGFDLLSVCIPPTTGSAG